MFFCFFCMESVLDMFFSFHWFWTPLVFCWVLQFHKNIRHVFSERVDSKFNWNSAIPPAGTPGSLNSPGRFQRFGEEITPLAGGKWKKWEESLKSNQMGWESQKPHWGFWGGEFGNCSSTRMTRIHIFRSGDPPKNNLYFSVSGRGGCWQHPKLDIASFFVFWILICEAKIQFFDRWFWRSESWTEQVRDDVFTIYHSSL